jgi:hypothetical protein
VVDFLGHPQHAHVRGTAGHSLRSWLERGPGNREELIRLLQSRRGYTKDKAELLLDLLQPVAENARSNPQTYQRMGELIEYLDHETLPIRELAFQRLALLVPEGARTIEFDPVWESTERRQAMEQWRKLVASK